MKPPSHKTKIVCAIGPASESQDVMERMLLAEMSVARLNLSHGDFESNGKVVATLRAASRSTGRQVAIMAGLFHIDHSNGPSQEWEKIIPCRRLWRRVHDKET